MNKELQKELLELEEQEKEIMDFFEKLEIKDKILEIKKKLNLIGEIRQEEGCENCSA